MVGKQCLKLGFTVLLLFAALVVGGCATTVYRATPEDTRDLSRAQARKLLIKAAQTDDMCADPRTVSATYEKIEITCANTHSSMGGMGKGRRRSFRYADYPALAVGLSTDPLGPYGGSIWINASGSRGDGWLFFWWGTWGNSNARALVRAWYVLARAGTVDPAQEAAFELAAQSYRNAQVKPQLPEEAVKYMVQAELAVRETRFDDAVDLYDKALGIAPWWPAGHYNRGLILRELQDIQGGIRALQKYLKLEPDASDARTVQLTIYQWQSLVPGAAK